MRLVEPALGVGDGPDGEQVASAQGHQLGDAQHLGPRPLQPGLAVGLEPDGADDRGEERRGEGEVDEGDGGGDEGGEPRGGEHGHRGGGQRDAGADRCLGEVGEVVDDGAGDLGPVPSSEARGGEGHEASGDVLPGAGQVGERDVVRAHPLGPAQQRPGDAEGPDPDDRRQQGEDDRPLGGADHEPAGGGGEGHAAEGRRGTEQHRGAVRP